MPSANVIFQSQRYLQVTNQIPMQRQWQSKVIGLFMWGQTKQQQRSKSDRRGRSMSKDTCSQQVSLTVMFICCGAPSGWEMHNSET